MSIDVARRHPSTQQIARWFDPSHLSPGKHRTISEHFELSASILIAALPDSAELTAGLRKLIEAKDCLVRCAIAEAQDWLKANRAEPPGSETATAGPNLKEGEA